MTVEQRILHDERSRRLRILADAGPSAWGWAITHPITTHRHLRAVTTPPPHHQED